MSSPVNGRTSSYFATIVKGAICKTNIISRPLPSVFHFPGLNTRPVHSPDSFPEITQLLLDKAPEILEEYRNLKSLAVNDYKVKMDEHRLHKGNWEWNSFILNGKEQELFKKHCPETTGVLNNVPFLMKTTPFSYAFFSTLKPQSQIAPHTGPCNIRIRCHLPLVVPEGDCGINIGGKEFKWTTGKPMFFDDCYEHYVYNNTNQERVLLLFDVWHPELHPDEISAIEEMFADAAKKGWTNNS